MNASTSTPVKSAGEKKAASAGVVLRGHGLNQEVDALGADLVRRHAQKLHDNGFPESAKTLIVKFAEARPGESITIRATG